jgi:hypothetical protein
MPSSPSGEEPAIDPSVSAVTITSRHAPGDLLPFAVARSHAEGTPRRSFTPLGTLAHGVFGELDGAGAVQVGGRRWILDWWVGAQDRWHHPCNEASVRQVPIERTPGMRTTLRVPGGEVHHDAVGALARVQGPGAGSTECVVVETTNGSPVPVALALAIRPWHLDAPGSLSSLRIDDLVVSLDDVPALVLPRMPARIAHGRVGAPAVALARGKDQPPVQEIAGEGDLEVALVFPLAHGANIRVVLPAHEPPRRRRDAPLDVSALVAPSVESVVKGWTAHDREDPDVGMPQDGWGSLVAWSGAMLRIAGPQELTRSMDPGAGRSAGADCGRRVTAVCEALAGLFAPELHDSMAAALCASQRRDGGVRMADGSDATAALLFVAAATLLGPRGELRVEELLDPVAGALRYLERRKAETGSMQARCVAVARSRLVPALVVADQVELAAEVLRTTVEDLAGPLVASSLDADPPDSEARDSAFVVAEGIRSSLLAGRPGAMDALSRHLARRGFAGAGDLLDAGGRPCGSSGFDVAELAAIRLAILDGLVSEGPRGPLLLNGWSPAWVGQDLQCSRVPTAWGGVSLALRWHGSRPALLWEIDPVGGVRGEVVPEVRAPSLDRSWRAGGWTGEALLAEPEVRG